MSSAIEWGKLNDRQLLEAWHDSTLMDRRQIESELRKRMTHPGPAEEALIAALIRDTRKPKPARKPRPKRKPIRQAALETLQQPTPTTQAELNKALLVPAPPKQAA